MKKLLINSIAVLCFASLADCSASHNSEKPLSEEDELKKPSGTGTPSSTYGSRSASPMNLSESDMPLSISTVRIPLRNKEFDVLFKEGGPLEKINPTLLMPTGDEWGTIIAKGSQGINDINQSDEKQFGLTKKLEGVERKIKENEQRLKDHNTFIEEIREDHFEGNKYPTSVQILAYKKPLEEKLAQMATKTSNEDYIRNPDPAIVDLQRKLLLINANPTDLQHKINALYREKDGIGKELESLQEIRASKNQEEHKYNLLFEVNHKTNVNLKHIGWPDDELFTIEWFNNCIINMGYPASLIDPENIELFTTAISKFGLPLVLLPVNHEEEVKYSPYEILSYLKYKVIERKKVVSKRLALNEEATSQLLLHMDRKKIPLKIQSILPARYKSNDNDSFSGKGQPVQFADFIQNRFLPNRKEVTLEMRNELVTYTNLNAANLIEGAIIDSPVASVKEELRRLPGDLGRDFILANFRKGQSSTDHVAQVQNFLLKSINEVLFDFLDLKRYEFIENRLTTVMTPKVTAKARKYITPKSIKLLSSSTSNLATLHREESDD